MNQNRSKTQKCSNFSTKSVVKFLTRNVVIFQPKVYQQIVDTLLVEKLQHFWVLLRFWFKSYYISGFYYNSGSKLTTFLVLLHFWLFTTFLGLTSSFLPTLPKPTLCFGAICELMFYHFEKPRWLKQMWRSWRLASYYFSQLV